MRADSETTEVSAAAGQKTAIESKGADESTISRPQSAAMPNGPPTSFDDGVGIHEFQETVKTTLSRLTDGLDKVSGLLVPDLPVELSIASAKGIESNWYTASINARQSTVAAQVQADQDHDKSLKQLLELLDNISVVQNTSMETLATTKAAADWITASLDPQPPPSEHGELVEQSLSTDDLLEKWMSKLPSERAQLVALMKTLSSMHRRRIAECSVLASAVHTLEQKLVEAAQHDKTTEYRQRLIQAEHLHRQAKLQVRDMLQEREAALAAGASASAVFRERERALRKEMQRFQDTAQTKEKALENRLSEKQTALEASRNQTAMVKSQLDTLRVEYEGALATLQATLSASSQEKAEKVSAQITAVERSDEEEDARVEIESAELKAAYESLLAENESLRTKLNSETEAREAADEEHAVCLKEIERLRSALVAEAGNAVHLPLSNGPKMTCGTQTDSEESSGNSGEPAAEELQELRDAVHASHVAYEKLQMKTKMDYMTMLLRIESLKKSLAKATVDAANTQSENARRLQRTLSREFEVSSVLRREITKFKGGKLVRRKLGAMRLGFGKTPFGLLKGAAQQNAKTDDEEKKDPQALAVEIPEEKVQSDSSDGGTSEPEKNEADPDTGEDTSKDHEIQHLRDLCAQLEERSNATEARLAEAEERAENAEHRAVIAENQSSAVASTLATSISTETEPKARRGSSQLLVAARLSGTVAASTAGKKLQEERVRAEKAESQLEMLQEQLDQQEILLKEYESRGYSRKADSEEDSSKSAEQLSHLTSVLASRLMTGAKLSKSNEIAAAAATNAAAEIELLKRSLAVAQSEADKQMHEAAALTVQNEECRRELQTVHAANDALKGQLDTMEMHIQKLQDEITACTQQLVKWKQPGRSSPASSLSLRDQASSPLADSEAEAARLRALKQAWEAEGAFRAAAAERTAKMVTELQEIIESKIRDENKQKILLAKQTVGETIKKYFSRKARTTNEIPFEISVTRQEAWQKAMDILNGLEIFAGGVGNRFTETLTSLVDHKSALGDARLCAISAACADTLAKLDVSHQELDSLKKSASINADNARRALEAAESTAVELRRELQLERQKSDEAVKRQRTAAALAAAEATKMRRWVLWMDVQLNQALQAMKVLQNERDVNARVRKMEHASFQTFAGHTRNLVQQLDDLGSDALAALNTSRDMAVSEATELMQEASSTDPFANSVWERPLGVESIDMTNALRVKQQARATADGIRPGSMFAATAASLLTNEKLSKKIMEDFKDLEPTSKALVPPLRLGERTPAPPPMSLSCRELKTEQKKNIPHLPHSGRSITPRLKHVRSAGGTRFPRTEDNANARTNVNERHHPGLRGQGLLQ